MKKVLAMLLALCLALGMLAGCGKTDADKTPAQDGEQAASDGVLHLMWDAQMGTDTIFESPWRDLQCLYPYMVFDSLFAYEADGTVVYKLAESHTVSEDGLVYTFTIRDGVTWSDGEPFTAEDVAFTLWGVLADPHSSFKSGFTYIDGAADVTDNGAAELAGVSVDGNVVTVTLSAPYSMFVSSIAKMYILPKHLLGEVAAEELSTVESYWKKPVGTGAYVIDEVSFPDYCTLVRNENYWGPAAGIEKVLLTSYATGGNDAVTNAMIAGELDFAYGREIDNIETATSISSLNADVKVLEMTSNYQRQFLFNCVESADGKLNDDMQKTEVRQAINMLLDKEAIAQIYGSNAAPLTTHLNPESAMYNTEIPAFARDVEGAKALLDEAGFNYDRTVRIAYYYTDQTSIDVMDLVVQNLAEAGIKAETFLLSGDLAQLIYVDRNYDMIYCGEAADDPGQMYFYLLGVNGYFDDILVDKTVREEMFNLLIDEYNATNTFEAQKTIAWKLQENGVELCAIAPVVTINKLALYNTARLEVPEDIFQIDWSTRDWRFEDWKLK